MPRSKSKFYPITSLGRAAGDFCSAKHTVNLVPWPTLPELRRAIHPDVKARVFAEIDKDLTKHPISDIERYFVG